jgi:alkylation response protein AidB-like acyl-CoA dehydrogenase
LTATANVLDRDALRVEVRGFLAEERGRRAWEPRCDCWLGGYDPDFSRRLGERGWIGMTFPRVYGGAEADGLARFTVVEELLAAGAPVAAHWLSDRQVGPALLRYGSEEQRREHLPPIVRGERFFAVAMSEPDTGSDLASARTRAAEVAGGWRLEGTKIWVSGAHHASHCVVLARTSPRREDRRHDGLSQFIVPLDADGVEVRPIRLLSGEHHFNEIILDGAVLDHGAVLGRVGEGWRQVTGELVYERSGPERFLSTFPLLVASVGELRRTGAAGSEAAIGALLARLWTLRQMSGDVAERLAAGEEPNLEAALVKDMGTRFEGESIEALRAVLPSGEVDPDSEDEWGRLLAEAVLHSPGFTLRGGTNEILRGIIAREIEVR